MTNDLIFSGESPIVINYNGNTDDIYAPVRTSSCDINIVSPKILDDLYTARKDQLYVTIEKDTYEFDEIITLISPGNIESYRILPTPSSSDYYKIYRKDQLFNDEYGHLIFKGLIDNGGTEDVEIMFVGGDWWDNSYWDLGETGRYMDIGGDIYKSTYEDGRHYYYSYDGGAGGHAYWVNKKEYNKVVNGVVSDCDLSPDHIVNYANGDCELVFGKSRYRFELSNNIRQWVKLSDYVFEDGKNYTATYGSWYHQVKRNGEPIDTICVNGYNGTENCIAKVDHANGTLRKIIPLKSGWDTFENVFTMDGNLYYITTNGVIWWWDWKSETWIEFVTIYGDITPGSVYLDYIGPIDDTYVEKMAVFKFDNTNSEREAFGLYRFSPPNVSVKKERRPNPVRSLVWEGYKMPNTYSQEVSLNLDTIGMTCIDPVSILKYVTVDKIFEKPNVTTFGNLIGKMLSTVMLTQNTLYVEDSVSYDDDKNLLELSCQVANFWDEADKSSTGYDMIEDLLRPFCLVLVFGGDAYYIYDQSKTSTSRTFRKYTIESNGSLTFVTTETIAPRLFQFSQGDWISNNTSGSSIEINNTYEKVAGVASTCVPTYSKMITDIMDYRQRGKYNYDDLNVQRNKTQGYVKDIRNIVIDPTHSHTTTVIEPVTEPRWFYLWNGVYCDAKYNLTDSQGNINWYNTCNKAKYYLDGSAGYPNNWGAALTFSGGADNPTATGKSQADEKSVKVSENITAYAADNGVPPEFLEKSDLEWNFSNVNQENRNMLTKTASSNSKFGTGISSGGLNFVVYHQEFENMCLSMEDDMVVELNLSQAYSRTGINKSISVMSNNTTLNKTYRGTGTHRKLATCDTEYFPPQWNAGNVTVDSFYFRRYSSSGTGGGSCRPVWDERPIKIYIKLTNGTYKQFDGKNWIDDDGSHSRGFILTKLMNGENLYHNDMKYDMIISSADTNYQGRSPIRYHLGTEEKKIYLDNDGGVTEEETRDYILCRPYESEDSDWYTWVAGSSDGHLSIKLPYIEDISATVYVDIYNSNLLGTTGNDGSVTGAVVDHFFPFYYTFSDTIETTADFEEFEECYADFLPANVSHIKAEHLDLKISITVPDSNLGQMFSEADIRYELDSNQNYMEEFETPPFRVNTVNPLVASSFSYIIDDSAYADPDKFSINGIQARPETYVVQAYMNWLGNIRKVYTKTIRPLTTGTFNNILTYITSPETGNFELLVVSDSWDLKSNRHTIQAVEDQHLEVESITPPDEIEIPREARADRYNLPTATRRR